MPVTDTTCPQLLTSYKVKLFVDDIIGFVNKKD